MNANGRRNVLYCNSTGVDLGMFHAEIAASLKSSGALPEDLADLFTVRVVPVEQGNPDGTPRYVIEAA